MPKQNPFIARIVIITTQPDVEWLKNENQFIEKVIGQTKHTLIHSIQVVHIPTTMLRPIVTEQGKNMHGEPARSITHEWFENNLTKAFKQQYNVICYHITHADYKALGMSGWLGGYWNDSNEFMELWWCADKGKLPPQGRTRNATLDGKRYRLTEYQWLALHELGHAWVHFATERKDEIRSRWGDDPVHYLDYVEHDVSRIFTEVSFEKWSLQVYLIALKNIFIELLKIKISTPKPPIAPQSRLEEWAKAIEEYEDYVPPGGRFKNGRIAPQGSLSYRNNNPGNLRWSPFEAGNRNNFSWFHTYEDGWNALLHQLRIATDGRSSVYRPNMTLLEFFNVYAPPEDNNIPNLYAEYVARRLNVPVSIQIKNLR